ncbi:serine/threonine-protein kinase [Spirillospora sp. NPDC048911]|uniref:serine/threonine-protein kinase n=1 Tax=Spirillospora sp. NPDC048911 TaxID=3364527 RepID=UPI003721ACD6
MSFPPTVGRYRIDRVLGSGAFASVWLGHDDALDAHVAIKVLSGSLIDDLDVRNRFLEEARILRRADSERLVRVHDIGELPDGRPYFVMSYADRGTLADRMRERPLPVFEALVLAEEIAYGVEVINTLGVIHRDLKPSNVLFQSTRDGGEKLLIADLGLAKALAHASGAFTLPVGTPGYMSPEQARFGGGLDVRADVYGLGALTYHMITGRPPGPAPVKVPPSDLREGMPPAFDQVILRALEVEREKRWPTAEAFAEALSTLRPTMPPGTQHPMYPESPVNLDSTLQDQHVGPQQPAAGDRPAHGAAAAAGQQGPPHGGGAPQPVDSPQPGVGAQGNSPQGAGLQGSAQGAGPPGGSPPGGGAQGGGAQGGGARPGSPQGGAYPGGGVQPGGPQQPGGGQPGVPPGGAYPGDVQPGGRQGGAYPGGPQPGRPQQGEARPGGGQPGGAQPGGPQQGQPGQAGQYGPPGGGYPAEHQHGGGPVPPGPAQPGTPGQPQPGAPGQQRGPFSVEPEPATRDDHAASDDDIRTSEMRVPPRPGGQPGPHGGVADDEKTIVDHPGAPGQPGGGPRYGPGESLGSPDDDRTVAVPLPSAYQAPPGPGPQQPSADEDRTTVLPTPQPPHGGGGPGHPQPPQGPLPTGFQTPQAGSEQPSRPSGGPMDRLKNIGLPGRSGGTGGPAGQQTGGGGRKQNKLMTPMIIAAVVLSIALVGGLLLGTLFNGGGGGGGKKPPQPPALPQDFVQIADPSGKIKLAAPNAWRLQSAERTWTTSIAALTDGKARPVLRATPSAAAFKGDGKSPGVFVGLTTDTAAGKLPPPGLIGHSQCTKGTPENYVSPDKALSGTITRFTACKLGTPSVTEIGLRDKSGKFGAWVRIKEIDNRNLTKTILDSLKLAAPE